MPSDTEIMNTKNRRDHAQGRCLFPHSADSVCGYCYKRPVVTRDAAAIRFYVADNDGEFMLYRENGDFYVALENWAAGAPEIQAQLREVVRWSGAWETAVRRLIECGAEI